MEPSVLHEYRAIKAQLVRWLQSLADVPAGSEMKTGSGEAALTVQSLLRGLSSQVQADTFKVAVVGEYSSGKSSLLNVLLRLHAADGRKADGLLPTHVQPTTAVITTLVYDEARGIEITLDDGQTLPVSAEQLNGFLTEPTLRRKKFGWQSNAEENERVAAHIKTVRVGCVSPLLGEGIELIDTPGIGSINKDHARITREFTAGVDAALFLVSVDPPMGEREMTFLQHIKTITDRCLFVQTKRDLGERTEHGEAVWVRREREHRRRIEEVLDRRDYPFFCVSAYQAAEGLRQEDAREFAESGFEALEAELQRFLVAERGVPRFAEWLKRSQFAFSLLEDASRVKQEQLEASLAGISKPVALEEDYAQWRTLQQALERALGENARAAAAVLAHKKPQFEEEITREAQRELVLTSAEQLAKNVERRLQIERGVVKSIQYHRGDLLMPVSDYYLEKAQTALEEAIGKDLPEVFRQFRSPDFDWQTSDPGIDLGSLVETRTYVQETRRGGLGFVDFFLGPVKTEVTEHNLDKERLTAAVEKTIEEAYREAKSGLASTLGEMNRAALSEMGRIVAVAKSAAEQQARIQRQDQAECQRQLQETGRQSRRLADLKADLVQVSASVQSLSQIPGGD